MEYSEKFPRHIIFYVALPDVFQSPHGLRQTTQANDLPQESTTAQSDRRRHDERIGDPPRRVHHLRVHVGVLRYADWSDRHPPQAHSFLQVSRGEGELEQC